MGPFDRLELDLSDGKGNSHLGPHILAGVNGSGKSTILRTIAWVLDRGNRGFPSGEWSHLIAGHPRSQALLLLRLPGYEPYVRACISGLGRLADERLTTWVQPLIGDLPINLEHPKGSRTAWLCAGESQGFDDDMIAVAAYSPASTLRHIPAVNLTSTLDNWHEDSLSFQTTVQNEAIQSWLLSLYSKRAIARERQQATEGYTQSLDRFEAALRLLYGEDVTFEVEIKGIFQPRLRVKGRSLNFSQLPDGIKATVGWIADFMMRQDISTMVEEGILLLDEIDAHLHPLWQRKLLPAVREALPGVQIIATTHSPFVISSCPGARVHVFDVDEHGKASNRPPVDSPIGESVTTTLKEIFGVDSRFDVQTEAELNEWNSLKKKEAAGRLGREEAKRLVDLTRILSERSEELKSIVAAPLTIPDSVLQSLAGVAQKKRKTG